MVSPSSSGGGADVGGGRTTSTVASTSPLSAGPVNLPAVLKDRVPNLRPQSSRGPHPPVPPRSPRRVNISVAGKSVNNSTPSKGEMRRDVTVFCNMHLESLSSKLAWLHTNFTPLRLIVSALVLF